MAASPAKNLRVALIAATVVFTMLGLSYAAVPFYKAFCKATGFGGTTQRAEKAPDKATDKFITVRFDANTSSGLGWDFHARQTELKVKIGEQTMAYFDARNTSKETLTGSAVFNVTPPSAGAYFDKIQCFCFTKHTLNNWLRMAGPTFDASLALEMMGFGGPEQLEGRQALVDKRAPKFPARSPY